VTDWSPVDAAAESLRVGNYDWVAFTSANGVENFLSRIEGDVPSAFGGAHIAAVGSATEVLLLAAGLQVSLRPKTFTAQALADALGPGSGHVLLPRAEKVPPGMVARLKENGWQADEVAVYRTVPADIDSPEAETVAEGLFDAVTFTSASTVEGFVGMFPDLIPALSSSGAPFVACIGPVTAAACADAGIEVDVEATEHTTDGLLRALATLFT
nr:uroporphyrinogen-III synthase [Actinomycetota bacterium]